MKRTVQRGGAPSRIGDVIAAPRIATITPDRIPQPIVHHYSDAGVYVVRDDLLPGGTKLRYALALAQQHRELVYASSAQGGAQLALAYAAKLTGHKATLFIAHRAEMHARTREAVQLGAKLYQVQPGYLNVVQARAKAYAASRVALGAFYVAFGGDSPEALGAIASAAKYVHVEHGPFDEVWSAAGSGVLTRGLQLGFPASTRIVAVCCGHEYESLGRAQLYYSGVAYGHDEKRSPPWPACPTYERKAWQFCLAHKRGARVLFWNVMGPSPTRVSSIGV